MDVSPELVRAVQRGQPGAMEDLIRATHVDVHRLALRILRDPTDAADATQEVFLRVMRSVVGFRGDAAFGTWLHRITVNVCATMLRRRGDQRARGQAAGSVPFGTDDLFDVADDVADTEGRIVELDEAGRVAEAIRSLSEDDRAIVVLRDIQGLSTREAAEVLGIGEGAAKVRLHRAHARLRKAIGASLGAADAVHASGAAP